MPNRHTRRRAAATKPRRVKAAPIDRNAALRIAAAIAEADGTVSGLTLITPDDDEPIYIDAATVRRGGCA
jgi:hypothetical protein